MFSFNENSSDKTTFEVLTRSKLQRKILREVFRKPPPLEQIQTKGKKRIKGKNQIKEIAHEKLDDGSIKIKFLAESKHREVVRYALNFNQIPILGVDGINGERQPHMMDECRDGSNQ